MSWCWEGFVKEGDVLFEYMQHHFTELIDDNVIKHFTIQYSTWSTIDYYIPIKEKYSSIIQKDLIRWIVVEFNAGRLIESTNWKPFRDSYTITDMYLGYNKLFMYKEYYFQLAITADVWDDDENCIYCINNNSIHFELKLYGWIENTNGNIVEPDRDKSILFDSMMPLSDWNRK